MSDSIEEGFKEAIVGVVGGIVLSVFLRIIPTLPDIPSYYVGLFQLLEIVIFVGSILVILKFESWGFWYLGGWLFGMWIMSISGLIENWLLILYLVVGGVVLVTKLMKKLGKISL